MHTRAVLLGCLAGCLGAVVVATSAHAQDDAAGHLIAHVGVHPVDPKSNNHPELTVEKAAGLSLDATYLLTQHWAVELFAAFPPAHEVSDGNGTRVARFSMMPLSATLQYHVSDDRGVFRTYAGAGISHARIGSERPRASLSGQTLELDDSTGLAAVLGLDVDLGSKWFINVDARWMDIDSSVRIDGTPRGTLEIDPYIFGVSVGRLLR